MVATSDGTYEDKRVRVIYGKEQGPAHKRNVGTVSTRAPFVVFLDDDVEVSPYCLYELWQGMLERPKCGMAFAKIYNMERRDEFDDCGSWLTWTGFLWARAGNRQVDRGQFDAPAPCLASKSATCIARRNTLLEVGGFDAAYFILGEETDLAWRMWLRGWECWVLPRALSWHAFGCESIKPRVDFYTIQRTMTYGCRNYLSLLWTNPGALWRAYVYPIHVSAWACAALGFLIRGDRQRALAIMRGLWKFLRALPDLQRKRHRVQSTRTVSDRALFQHIYANPGVGYYLKRMWRYWVTQLHG